MGAAPMAYVLWTRFLRHAPTQPDWPDRDRFVLSAGHASMLLYSLLHLTGYDLPLDELEQFRQWGSRTPGHPEYGLTPGVEATTGPLGQGFANAVGMAIAERRLARRVQPARPRRSSTTGRTCICSDGDLQEGIAAEAASLAGHLRLGKLIFLYDDNHIQLDGPTSMACSEDVLQRFDAYGWHTQRVADGNDLEAIDAAIEAARDDERPSLIAVRTHIGYGSPNKQDSQKAHGSPLGRDEVRLTKEAYGWDPDKTVLRPRRGASRCSRGAIPRGEQLVARLADPAATRYARRFPDRDGRAAAPARRRPSPTAGTAGSRRTPSARSFATRQASQAAIQALAEPRARAVRRRRGPVRVQPDRHQGRRRLRGRRARPQPALRRPRARAWAAIANGIAYHGGFIPYAGTFLNFSDYMRGSVRLAALSRAPRDLRLDPRLGRARRGRPDPPAGRALRRAAGDAQPVVRAAGRCQRDGRPPGPWRSSARRRPGRRLSLTRQKLTDAAGDRRTGPRRRRAGAATSLREVERRARVDRTSC